MYTVYRIISPSLGLFKIAATAASMLKLGSIQGVNVQNIATLYTNPYICLY